MLCKCRVRTLSDEELLYLLEQAQNSSFPSQLLHPGTSHVDARGAHDSKAPFPAAEPDLMPQKLSPLDSAGQGKPGSAKGRMSGMPRRLKQVPAEQIASDTQPLSEEPAEKQKTVDIAAESMTRPAATSQQAASEATISSADDWKFKLQAFAKPLMQQMQGKQLYGVCFAGLLYFCCTFGVSPSISKSPKAGCCFAYCLLTGVLLQAESMAMQSTNCQIMLLIAQRTSQLQYDVMIAVVASSFLKYTLQTWSWLDIAFSHIHRATKSATVTQREGPSRQQLSRRTGAKHSAHSTSF